MSSLLTNSSAMVALTTLRGINDSMATTQNRISTGMRVADASDNAAYWSIATTMKSDNSALSAVRDSLGLGAATVDVAFTALDQAEGIVDQIKSKLTAATNGALDPGKIQSDVSQLQEQLKTIASSASFSGENWLQQDMATATLSKEIAGGFTRNAAGNTEIQNISVDTTSAVLIDTRATAADNTGLLSRNIIGTAAAVVASTTTAAPTFAVAAAGDFSGVKLAAYEAAVMTEFNKLDDTQKAAFTDGDAKAITDKVDVALAKVTGTSLLDFDISGLGSELEDVAVVKGLVSAISNQHSAMTDGATDLGSAKARVDMQKEFASNLSDAIDRGIGQLVDADMNAESTRLQALQTQQQLGIQALSIANSGSQNILSLFR
ncbi:flagellin [Pseudovibrio ascidiaceicola]|uniref:flagellin N-terminal helical domain-containing protein n=1 Tax=Pseudovibrio ascidiaceicola TaxID=285279 RepID=UPI000D68AFD0|nr:flagellin [Pseudovibrio ascidiaceicola]